MSNYTERRAVPPQGVSVMLSRFLGLSCWGQERRCQTRLSAVTRTTLNIFFTVELLYHSSDNGECRSKRCKLHRNFVNVVKLRFESRILSFTLASIGL